MAEGAPIDFSKHGITLVADVQILSGLLSPPQGLFKFEEDGKGELTLSSLRHLNFDLTNKLVRKSLKSVDILQAAVCSSPPSPPPHIHWPASPHLQFPSKKKKKT